jgi:DNA-directed RNA polymerase specialized sigma24 family protein
MLLRVMIANVMVRPEPAVFAAFVRDAEPRLLHALVASCGPVEGRAATVDALSWAWEHWDRLGQTGNKLAYLYRVGQTAARRNGSRAKPGRSDAADEQRLPDVEPALLPALAQLSDQQRTAVLLVHGFGWSQTDVAQLLDVNVSTVREHLARGLIRLRTTLGVNDVR